MKPRLFSHLALFAAAAIGQASAGTLYWKTSAANAWNSSSWSAVPGGPYTTAWVDGSEVVFESNCGTPLTITGATVTLAGLTANEHTTVSPTGTLLTDGKVVPVTVAEGKILDFNGQAVSSADGTGFIKNGEGTWYSPGNTYNGGFTLNAGTMGVGGVNALGSGGTLTINGGTLRTNTGTARNLSGKLTGIAVNSDVWLGDTGYTGGTGALTFDAPVNLGGANRTLTVNTGTTLSGAASLGNGGLTKIGHSLLTLSGNTVHTFTGGLTLGGISGITLNCSNLATPENLIDPANSLTFAYGAPTLTLTGKASVVTRQTIGNVTLNHSRATIAATPGADGTLELNLGTIHANLPSGSGVLLLDQPSGTKVTTASAPDASGIFGPRVVTRTDGATWHWAATDSAVAPYAIKAFSSYAAMTDEELSDNNHVLASANLTTSTDQTHRTLKVAGGVTLTLGAGTLLTLTGGGILMEGADNTITGGAITAGDGGSTMGYNPYELVITPANAANATISPVIADYDMDHPVSLTINGSTGNPPTGAVVTLGTANTYTGTTTINGGSTVGGVNAVGGDFRTLGGRLNNAGTPSTLGKSGDIVLNGAILRIDGSDTTDRPFVLSQHSGFHTQGNTVTLNGSLSGSGRLSVDGNPGTGGLKLGGDNSYSGEIMFQTDGKLVLTHANALKNATLNLTGQRITADLSSNNLAYQIGGIKGNGIDLNLGTGGGAGGMVTIGSNNQSNACRGALSGSAGLVKTGAGTQTLVKAAHTGDTIVEQGTLKLGVAGPLASASRAVTQDNTMGKAQFNVTFADLPNLAVGQTIKVDSQPDNTIFAIDSGTPKVYLTNALASATYTTRVDPMDGSIAHSPVIEVKAGATLDVSALTAAFPVSATQTLGGAGTVAGAVAVAGKIAPGLDAAGTLTTGNLAFGATGSYECTLNGAVCDVLAAGTLTVDSAAKITVTGTPTLGEYVIATYTGAEPTHFDASALPAGYSLSYATPGQIKLLVNLEQTPFQAWATGDPNNLTGADALPGADPDGDGVANILEFALGGDPKSGASRGFSVAKVQEVAGSPALTLTLLTRAGATFDAGTGPRTATRDGVTYRVEAGTDLSGWAATVGEVAPALTAGLPAAPAGYEYHTFRTAGPLATTPKDFIRVKVEGQ